MARRGTRVAVGGGRSAEMEQGDRVVVVKLQHALRLGDRRGRGWLVRVLLRQQGLGIVDLGRDVFGQAARHLRVGPAD